MTFTTIVSTSDLASMLDSGNVVVLDCRFDLMDTEKGRRAYAESHIPGAIFADVNRDLSAPVVKGVTGRHPLPDIATVAQKLGAWGIGNGIQVVAYDDSGGNYAARAWWVLRWLGHNTVAVLDGGWKAWLRENRPVANEIPTPAAKPFSARMRIEMVADAADVERIVAGEEAATLLDARAADRFRGENEMVDPVAGHIPGARNVPWQGNVDANGYLLPAEALQARLAPFLGDGDEAVAYCGSGVTAALNLLALEVAGKKGARLYPGSWSEWITDPSRPLATGA